MTMASIWLLLVFATTPASADEGAGKSVPPLPSEGARLLAKMNDVMAAHPAPVPIEKPLCAEINDLWKEASNLHGASTSFDQAVENFHFMRSKWGCLNCPAGVRCSSFGATNDRWDKYQETHQKLEKCLGKGATSCTGPEIEELQLSLRLSARVLLGELSPKDKRWPLLLASFTMVISPDGTTIQLFSEKERAEWSLLLQIGDKTRSPLVLKAVDETLTTLLQRYRNDPVKAKKYADLSKTLNANPSHDAVVKIIRALDVTELEDAQKNAERTHTFPVLLVEYRSKRLYTVLDLPAACPADPRLPDPSCEPIYQLADRFSFMLNGRALAGTTLQRAQSLDTWIKEVTDSLTPGAPRHEAFKGQFAGGVGLQVKSTKSGKVIAKVQFAVQAMADDPLAVDKGTEEGREIGPEETLEEGRRLADAVVKRCSLLKAFDRQFFDVPPSSPPSPPTNCHLCVEKDSERHPHEGDDALRKPPPSAAWSLMSAGAPLLLDGAPEHRRLGIALSAVDMAALVGAATFFIRAKTERDDYATGRTMSLGTADDAFAWAVGLLVVAGVTKVSGLVASLVIHHNSSEP